MWRRTLKTVKQLKGWNVLGMKHLFLSFKLSSAMLRLKLCGPHFCFVTWVPVSLCEQGLLRVTENWRREKIVVPSDYSLSLSISLQQLLSNHSSVGTAVGFYLQFFPYPKRAELCLGDSSACQWAPLLRAWTPVLWAPPPRPYIHSFFLQLLFLGSL